MRPFEKFEELLCSGFYLIDNQLLQILEGLFVFVLILGLLCNTIDYVFKRIFLDFNFLYANCTKYIISKYDWMETGKKSIYKSQLFGKLRFPKLETIWCIFNIVN